MPNTIPPRGVRKVSELVTQKGRALILSEEDANKLRWSDIPVSTLKINPKNGIMSVKLEGESDWVPAGIRNDGTICISKDGKIAVENFTIKNINFAQKTFSYTLESGDVRNSVIDDSYGFVFNLEAGSYQPKRNQIEVIIDDILVRSKASGGVSEISETSFGIKDSLVVEQEITAKYNCVLRIGSPYPRFFLGENEPDLRLAETGDFWLDHNATMEQEVGTTPEANPNEVFRRVNWSDIVGRPDTLYGMGIKDKVSYEGHTHKKTDITDFPTSMRANGGNADTVNGFTANANQPGTLAILDSNGKIPPSMIYNHRHNINEIDGLQNILDSYLARMNQEMNNFKTLMQKKSDETINAAKKELEKIKFEENVANDYVGYYKMPNGLMIQWGYKTVEDALGFTEYMDRWFRKNPHYHKAKGGILTYDLNFDINFNPHFVKTPFYVGYNIIGSKSAEVDSYHLGRPKSGSYHTLSESAADCVRWKNNVGIGINISIFIPPPSMCIKINDNEHIFFTWIAIGV